MNGSTSPNNVQTRLMFRILAGIIAAFVLLVGLPAALHEAMNGAFGAWVFVLCCLFGGIGLANGARTGRWFNSIYSAPSSTNSATGIVEFR